MIDHFILLIENNKKFIFTIFAILFSYGIYSINTMNRQMLPNIESKIIAVTISDTHSSALETASNITTPLEKKLEHIKNLVRIKSYSYSEQSYIVLFFEKNANMKDSINSINQTIDSMGLKNKYSVFIPKNSDFNSYFPALEISISSYGSEKELGSYTDKLEEEIRSIYGVSSIQHNINTKSKIQIILDPEKIELYSINPKNISINNNKSDKLNIGQINGQDFSIKLQKTNNIEKIKNTPVTNIKNKIIKIKDIGTVEEVKDISNEIVVGNKLAMMSVFTTGKVSIENVVQKIKNKIDLIEKPEGLIVQTFSDLSKKIDSLIEELLNTIITTIIAITMVMAIFIGFNHGLVASIIIPISISCSFLILQIIGYTINAFSLIAIILSVGIIIDNAILIIEEAHSNQKNGQSIRDSYRNSIKTVYSSIISSTLTTIISFTAIAIGTHDIAYFVSNTIMITLLISMIVALTLIPLFGMFIDEIFQNKIKNNNLKSDKLFNNLEKKYENFIEHACKCNKKSLTIILLSFSACFIIPIIYMQFARDMKTHIETDINTSSISIKGNNIYNQDTKLNIMSKIKDVILHKYSDQIQDTTVQISGENKIDIGTITVRLNDPWERKNKSTTIFPDSIKLIEEMKIPEIRYIIDSNNDKNREIKDATGNNVKLIISSSEQENLTNIIRTVTNYISTNQIGYSIDTSALGISNDVLIELNEEAIKYQIDEYSVFNHLVMISKGGLQIGRYPINEINNSYMNVSVKYPHYYNNKQQLDNMKINIAPGISVPIKTVIDTKPYNTVHFVERDQRKFIDIIKFTNISNKSSQEIYLDIINQFPEFKNNIFTPVNYNKQFTSEADDEKNYLINAALFGILGIFLVLLAQFNSFYQPGIILTSILFSTTGITIGYIVTGITPVISTTGLAFILLSGIVVNDNIVLVSTYNMVRNEVQDPVEALVITGRKRLKPVLLTSLTTIIGLIPSALKLSINFASGQIIYDSPNSDFMYNISIPIIFGISFDTIVTLIITPVLLITCYRIGQWWQNKNY